MRGNEAKSLKYFNQERKLLSDVKQKTSKAIKASRRALAAADMGQLGAELQLYLCIEQGSRMDCAATVPLLCRIPTGNMRFTLASVSARPLGCYFLAP